MSDDRMGGLALIAGAVGGIVTMVLHPTGHDITSTGGAHAAVLNAAVHGFAIALLPVSLLGALALSRRLLSPDRLSIAALVVYGFGLIAAMAAAAVSGFVTPALIRAAADDAAAGETLRPAVRTAYLLNQAFARILVVASSAAIVLWSIAMAKLGALGRGTAIYGLVLGPVLILAVASGHLRLDVHGFGLAVLAQSVWFVLVGAALRRPAGN